MPAHAPIIGCSPGLFAYFDQLWYAASESQRANHLTPRVASLENTAADQLVEDARARIAYDHALRVVTPAILDDIPALVTHAERLRSLPFAGGSERQARINELFGDLAAEVASRFPDPLDASTAIERERRAILLRACEAATQRVLRVSGFASCVEAVRRGSVTVKHECGGGLDGNGRVRLSWRTWTRAVHGVVMVLIRRNWSGSLSNANVRTIRRNPDGAGYQALVDQLAAGVDVNGLAGQALTKLDEMVATTEA